MTRDSTQDTQYEPIIQKEMAEVEFRTGDSGLGDYRLEEGEVAVYEHWVRINNHVLPRRRVEGIHW